MRARGNRFRGIAAEGRVMSANLLRPRGLRLFGLLVLAPVFLLSIASWADALTQVRQTIARAYSQYAAAFGKRDLPGCLRIYAPSYRETGVTGTTYGFLKIQAGTARAMAGSGPMGTTQITIKQFILHSNQAGVVVAVHFVNRFPRSARSRSYGYIRDLIANDQWIKRSGGWRLVSRHLLRDQITYQH